MRKHQSSNAIEWYSVTAAKEVKQMWSKAKVSEALLLPFHSIAIQLQLTHI